MSAEVRGGAMECDGPDQTQAVRPIWLDTARTAGFAQLDDSILLELAADVIDGWTPPRVDLLAEALRDRAAQFAAVEHYVPGLQFPRIRYDGAFAPAGLWHLWEQVQRDAQLHPTFTIPPRFVPPLVPARGRTNEPEPAGMRPRRAQQITRALLAAAVLALVLAVGVLWIGIR